MATVLDRLARGAEDVRDFGSIPFLLAERIADNRMVAGVHFPVDNAHGALLGVIAMDLVACAAGAKVALRGVTAVGSRWDADFTAKRIGDALGSDGPTAPGVTPFPVDKPSPLPDKSLLRAVWAAAEEELAAAAPSPA